MPKLSIIVPTRERADTLFHALRTLVEQDYGDCEILVSDNASRDNTRETVESFSDPRIRYLNTGRRIDMSGNWEFALRHAQGEYVTYLGDDDGFLPGGVGKAMRILEDSGAGALAWTKVEYFWPNCVDKSRTNWILFLRARNVHIRTVDGRRRLAKAMRFHSPVEYLGLPSPYWGIVRKSLLDKVVESSPSRTFFYSVAPDVFSSIAVAAIVGSYLFSDHPFSIAGASGHSTGSSFSTQLPDAHNSSSARFTAELSLAYDKRLRLCPSVATSVIGEYLLARENMPSVNFPEPNWDRYVRLLVRAARNSPVGDEILLSAAHTAKATDLKIRVPDHVQNRQVWKPTPGVSGDVLNFRAPLEMVSNIYDASHLVAGMLPHFEYGKSAAPVKRFLKNLSGTFIAEAKALYRAI